MCAPSGWPELEVRCEASGHIEMTGGPAAAEREVVTSAVTRKSSPITTVADRRRSPVAAKAATATIRLGAGGAQKLPRGIGHAIQPASLRVVREERGLELTVGLGLTPDTGGILRNCLDHVRQIIGQAGSVAH